MGKGMSRSIHIYCDGGFGNRFNGLLSGLLLADAAGLQPVVVWPRNNWCGASYAQLIASKANVIERELASYVPEKDDFQFFMTEDHLNMGVENKSPLQTESLADALTYLAKSSKDVYFHTPLIPTFFDTQKLHVMVRNLQFSATLYERARQFIVESDLVDYLGLQIRKTDFGANAADDNNLFDLVTNCPQKQFFVCSDSKEVEQRFQTLPNVTIYPKRAHVELMVPGEWSTTTADHSGRLYASNVNRNDVSVEDAVVDLLILARSQIVRTSHSTFLNTALLLKQAGAEYPPVATAETNRFSVDMSSLDRYFQSHFEYSGHPIQVDISPDQHTHLFTRLQEQWTDYGANSPYTSVLSDEKYLMSRIEENRDEFNESGETPVTWFQTLAARNDIKIPKGSCFELGCGVGRVTKPLAGIFDRVVAAVGVPDARMRVVVISSYLVGIAASRYLLRIEPLASATDDEVVALVGPTVQVLLDPTRKPGSS
jgi:hypothetical protein